MRKAAYGHEEAIFSAFDENHTLSYASLVIRVVDAQNVSANEAEEIINAWVNKQFINRAVKFEVVEGVSKLTHTSTDCCSISHVLTYDDCKLTQDDVTRDAWLTARNKKLKFDLSDQELLN